VAYEVMFGRLLLPFVLTRPQMEARRMAAADQLERGLSLSEIARRFGTTPASVCRWAQALRSGGREALRARKAPGGTPKLTPEQFDQLYEILVAHTPTEFGWESEQWTSRRVAELLDRLFGVRYHPGAVRRVLSAMGLSFQKPHRQARERDDVERARWLRGPWRRVGKKSPGGRPGSSRTKRGSG
jgi:transposase